MASFTNVPRNALHDTTTANQKMAQATAVILPLLELGAIGYVTWVVCEQICVEYLIRPSTELQQDLGIVPRQGAGIAIIVIYAILLVLLLLPWMRMLLVIWSKADILPVGDPSVEKKDIPAGPNDKYDAYVCDYEGHPLFCDKCHMFKPDRAHHCKELGRCIRKMDHYCPWAGGIIGESTHKFFMQFVFHVTIYTTFILVVLAVFFAERSSKGSRPGTWIGALAVAAVFTLFGGSMTIMTGQNLFLNATSVEAIQRGGVSNIAFHITRMPSEPIKPPTPPTPSNEVKGPDDDYDWPVLRIVQRSGNRLFVVMQTKPLENVWTGDYMQNWKEAMGSGPLEWLLPFKRSPSLNRSRHGEFEWGSIIYAMAQKYEKDNPGVRLALLEGIHHTASQNR